MKDYYKEFERDRDAICDELKNTYDIKMLMAGDLEYAHDIISGNILNSFTISPLLTNEHKIILNVCENDYKVSTATSIQDRFNNRIASYEPAVIQIIMEHLPRWKGMQKFASMMGEIKLNFNKTNNMTEMHDKKINVESLDSLDGFILSIFKTNKSQLSNKDFDNENIWVCELLDQDIELANEFIAHKITKCNDRMEKLQFLYESRGCFNRIIEGLTNELQPGYTAEYYSYKTHMTETEMIKRLNTYKQALSYTNQAICLYIDCSTINTAMNIERQTNTTIQKNSSFKLSDKTGAKIDLIRILNALYELHLIQNKDGQHPSKLEFFKTFGEFIDTDLSNYHTSLSQSLKNQPLEVNLKVFDEMKKHTEKSHYTNQENLSKTRK